MNATTVRPPCFGTNYRLAEDVAAALALLANALLAWLVVKHSRKEMSGFKRILLLGCGVDSAFAISFNLFEIVGLIRDGAQLMRKPRIRASSPYWL
ncbi:hypothetical protein AAVH_30520 [Aphelenchoides avenae]|nr:hypothetical protein AAVH_30520 [Aphelenchus avenae]